MTETKERYWSAEGVAPEEAKWRLARFLYETMERFDPVALKDWDDLDPSGRDFYHDVIAELLDMEGLLKAASPCREPPSPRNK